MREMHILGRPVSCGAVALILAVVLCTFPVWWPMIDAHIHWLTWERMDVKNYELETMILRHPDMEYIQVTVLDGQIVEGFPDRNCPKCEPYNLSYFAPYSIDGIFSRAFGCLILCRIEYDAQYGFPKNISQPFGGIQVIEFRLLNRG